MKRVPKAQLEQIRERCRAAAAETRETLKKLREDLAYLSTDEAEKKFTAQYIDARRLELISAAKNKIGKLSSDTAPYLAPARLAAQQFSVDELLWNARFVQAPDAGAHQIKDNLLLESERAILNMSAMFGQATAALADNMERQRWRERLMNASAERFRQVLDEALEDRNLAVLSVCEEVARTRNYATPAESAAFKSPMIAAKAAIATPEGDETLAMIHDIEEAWKDHESANAVIQMGGAGVDRRAAYREFQSKLDAEKSKPADKPKEEPVNQ